ncbi:MAG: hypothetical protein HY764_03245 [Candidatus Portnoybacteria bacterium]|nr:hypothetical protein [Candidatus Portnoybacteria bacterium]
MPKQKNNNIVRDLILITLSVIIAVILAKTGALEGFLAGAKEYGFLGSLIAGMFFVSIFTAAPAGVVLFEIAAAGSMWEVALLGAIGAMIGDLLIFRFIKVRISKDVSWLIRKTKQERLASIFRLKLFRWLVPFFGALIIVSPLPDELGLAMMGLSKMKTAIFMPMSFVLNFLGILIIGLFAKDLL